MRTKNELVFIPPPVDPGEAPIIISIIITSSPDFENVPSEYVANPAVLADTLIKNAPIHEIFSVILRSRAPAIISTILTDITILVCIENFFHLNLFSHNSHITKKPIPPKNTSVQVIILSAILPL